MGGRAVGGCFGLGFEFGDWVKGEDFGSDFGGEVGDGRGKGVNYSGIVYGTRARGKTAVVGCPRGEEWDFCEGISVISAPKIMAGLYFIDLLFRNLPSASNLSGSSGMMSPSTTGPKDAKP